MALQEGNSESGADITSWLKSNNLDALIDTFRDREITLEELHEIVQFGDEDFLYVPIHTLSFDTLPPQTNTAHL